MHPDRVPTADDYLHAASNGGVTADLLDAYPRLDLAIRSLIVERLQAAELSWAAEGFVAIDRAIHEHEATRRKAILSAWTSPIVRRSGALPEAYWDSREELGMIRQAAQAARIAPDALLGACLARLAFLVSPKVQLPALVGAEGAGGTLDLIVALVGSSGAGKSTAMSAAERFMPHPIGPTYVQRQLGSGEGVAEQYIGWVEKEVEDPKDPAKTKTVKVREQTRFHGLFTLDEGQMLRELGSRQGSSLWPTIRSAWSGSALGAANANKDRDRELEARSYRFALLVGFQPEYAYAVLDDLAGGTPQRFMWLTADDPRAPDVRPTWPGPLWDLDVERLDQITVHSQIAAELDVARVAQLRGERKAEAIDSHRGLLRLKIAALHAVLDYRRDVSWEDWGLAGMVLEASDEVRHVVSQAAIEARQRVAAEAVDTAARKAVAAKAAVEDASVGRALEGVTKAIANHVHRGRCEGGCTAGCASKAAAGPQRAALAAAGLSVHDAVRLAVDRLWITEDMTPGTRRP